MQKRKISKTGYVLLTAWVLMWLVPWGKWLAYAGHPALLVLSEAGRLGVALGLYLVPGGLLFLILRGRAGARGDWSGLLPIGFTFSTLLAGLIGLVGRGAGWSFGTVTSLFALVGLVEIWWVSRSTAEAAWSRAALKTGLGSFLRNVPLLGALLLGFVFSGQEGLFGLNLTGPLTGIALFVVSLIVAVISFLLLYAFAEFIYLFLSVEENTRRTAYLVQQQVASQQTVYAPMSSPPEYDEP